MRTLPEPGSQLGKYRLDRELGAGGMGTVYLAVDEQLSRTVALKVLSPERAENETLVKRFHSEAQAAAQLRHENIVTVFDSGEADGLLYIALEFVDGRDVHEMIVAAGRMDVSRSAGIIKQTAIALQHAYEKGIVHRDIKPSNLMVDRKGIVKLADMGLARSVDDTTEAGITRAGTTVGTVDYMSPEQARDSKAADVRSDIYSLGCTWFHMLTGQVPFPGGSLTNKLYAHAAKQRPDPRKADPGIPEAVVTILHRMMDRSPKNRYQTPAELVEALDALRDAGVKDEEQEEFAAQLAAVVESMPEVVAIEDSPPSTRVDKRTRAEGRRRRSGQRSDSSPAQRKRRRKKSKKKSSGPGTGMVIGVALTVVLLIAGGTWWALSGPDTSDGDDTPGTLVTDGDPVDPDGPPDPDVDPTDPDPDPVDPPDPGPRVISPRITIGSAEERPHLPDWLAGVLLPEEASAPPPRFALEVVNVGGPGARYRDLTPALEAAPRTGRVVQLNGPGPYVLNPLRLEDRRHIVIAGRPGERPLVWVDAADTTGNVGPLVLRNTSLTIVDVDIVVAGDPEVGSYRNAVSVSGGDLALRRCSVTIRREIGEPSLPPTSLFHVAGAVEENGPRAPSVLFDRVLARGGHACLLDAQSADVLVFGSVLATGSGPALHIGDGVEIGRRRIDLVRSTVYAAENAVSLGGTDSGPPRETAVTVRNSVIATREPGATLVNVDGWPIEDSGGSARFGVRGLAWTTVNSVYAGWDHSVHAVHGDRERTVDGAVGWQQSVEPGSPSSLFQSRWPSVLVDTASTTPPNVFDTSKGSVAPFRGVDGRPIGADVSELGVPSGESESAAATIALRPGIPEALVPEAVAPIEIAIAGRDLGRYLSSDEVPDGAHVVVTGSGSHASTPIFLDGKSLRLEFRPTGDEFVVSVRGARLTDEQRRLGRTAAFITVRNATLEVVNGVFRMTAGAIGTPAEWFLHATDSSFAFRGCELRGPVLASKSLREMIRWEASRDATASQRAIFDSTFAVATRPLLAGSLRNRTVLVRNSVLAAREVLFDIDVTGFERDLDATFDVRDSTLCVDGVYFEIGGRNLPGGVGEPMRFHVDRTVFGEPVGLIGGNAERGPVLFEATGAVIEQRQFVWNGRDNGFTSRIHAFAVESADGPAQSFDDSWAAREVHPHHGRIAFTEVEDGNRAAYELEEGSGASRWRLDGGPIGADTSIRQSSPDGESEPE